MDCGPPDSSVHEISQERILEWVAISPARGSSQPRIELASLQVIHIEVISKVDKLVEDFSGGG